MSRFATQADLEAAIVALIAKEPRFAAVHARHGTPSLRKAPATLETLLITVTEQFLSLKAAAAIWQRLKKRIGRVTADRVLAVSITEFMALGLSRSKARCFHACAEARLNFRTLPELPLEEVRAALLDIWGIGPWTADIFLLSVIGHADAWPVGDVALQAAAQDLFRLRKRPDPRKLEKIGAKWRPHRAAAARLLWAHYRGLKHMPQAPSQN